MRAIALALLSAAGQIERSSETYKRRYGDSAELVHQSPELSRVLAGDAERAAVLLGAGGQATLEAVSHPDFGRRTLLIISAESDDAAPNALLAEPLDESPAIVWLKDMAGRYMRVNRHYTAYVGISEDRFHGRMDSELASRETIDGPRMQDREQGHEEPLQFEYTVPEFEGRRALSVLRFPVRDGAGNAFAACSVAAPVEAAQLAHSEAARLMEIERFSRLGLDAVRGEFLREWGIIGGGERAESMPPPGAESMPPPTPGADAMPPPPPGADAMPRPDQPPPQPPAPGRAPPQFEELPAELIAERDAALASKAELGRELAHAQLRLAELDGMRAQTESVYSRVEELERELGEARERAAHAEAEARQIQERAEHAEAEARQTQERAAHAEAEARRAHEHVAQAAAEAGQAFDQVELTTDIEPRGQPQTGGAHAPMLAGEEHDGFDSTPRWLPTSQRKLSASLGRMSVWRTVLKETATIIGSEGGWDAVTAWVPDGDGGLTCAAMWVAHPGLSDFESQTWGVPDIAAGSLPAQAVHAPHLTWVTEIDAVDDERLVRAATHGLRSALLLPVRDGAETVALLELLAHASVSPDPQIAISLEAAALQLGQFGHLLRVSGRPSNA